MSRLERLAWFGASLLLCLVIGLAWKYVTDQGLVSRVFLPRPIVPSRPSSPD